MMSAQFDALKLDNQLCFPLYAAAKSVTQKYKPYLDEIGLTYTQYIVMMVLWECGKATVGELGARLYLDSGTLTPLLKKLEQKGSISRERSEKDERIVNITLTAKGLDLRGAAADIPAKIAGCIPLTPDDALQLYTLLYKILR